MLPTDRLQNKHNDDWIEEQLNKVDPRYHEQLCQKYSAAYFDARVKDRRKFITAYQKANQRLEKAVRLLIQRK